MAKKIGIKRNEKGTWDVNTSIIINDRKICIRKKGFLSKQEAVFWKERKIAELIKCEDTVRPVKYVVRDVFNDYLNSFSSKWKKSSTISKYYVLAHYLNFNNISNMDISSAINIENLKNFKNHIINMNISEKRKNIILNSVVEVYKRCKKLGIISPDELSKIELTLESIKEKKEILNDNINNDFEGMGIISDNSYFTKDEFDKFMNVIDKNSKWRPFFMVLFYCGLRFGECSGLQWKHFDEKTRVLHITQQATNKLQTGKMEIVSLKTASSFGSVELANPVYEELMRFKKYTCENPNDFIFFKKPISLSEATRQKNKFCKMANLKIIKIHGFRHSCASYLLNLGCSMQVVKEHLRHKSITTTMNIYGHLYKENMVSAISKMV